VPLRNLANRFLSYEDDTCLRCLFSLGVSLLMAVCFLWVITVFCAALQKLTRINKLRRDNFIECKIRSSFQKSLLNLLILYHTSLECQPFVSRKKDAELFLCVTNSILGVYNRVGRAINGGM